MYRKLAIAAVTAAAVLGTFAVALAGTAAAYTSYYVRGTHTANVRAQPNVRAAVIDHRNLGDLLPTVCQTRGDSVTDPVTRFTSNIWDKIIIGGGGIPPTIFYGYVSDLYASSPVAGDFSPGVPQCAGPPPPHEPPPPPGPRCNWHPANNAQAPGYIHGLLAGLGLIGPMKDGPDYGCGDASPSLPLGELNGLGSLALVVVKIRSSSGF